MAGTRGPRNHVSSHLTGRGSFDGGRMMTNCNVASHGECVCPVHAADE